MPCIAWTIFPGAYKTQMELLDALVKRAPESNHPEQVVRIAIGMYHRETQTSH
jgi:hypothetical protein